MRHVSGEAGQIDLVVEQCESTISHLLQYSDTGLRALLITDVLLRSAMQFLLGACGFEEGFADIYNLLFSALFIMNSPGFQRVPLIPMKTTLFSSEKLSL